MTELEKPDLFQTTTSTNPVPKDDPSEEFGAINRLVDAAVGNQDPVTAAVAQNRALKILNMENTTPDFLGALGMDRARQAIDDDNRESGD